MKIFMDGKFVPLKKALTKMTDNWIDDGQYCDQTVIDMREALIKLTKKTKKG